MTRLKTTNHKRQTIPRPPTVVILGHVDSGKTTLLDFIRKSNVVGQESGGITQHIGAYQITYRGKIINFIDTPGHEAFSAMRSRGAKVADIAVLVVACDQGVKPQTKEAIAAITKAQIPMIVALNKMDLPHLIPQKVKKGLNDCKVMIEEFGGKIPCLEISAKTGQGLEDLLEMLILVGEMEELSYNPKQAAQGVVVESHLAPRRGPTATVLITDGQLSKNDVILAGGASGKIKTLEDANLKSIASSEPGPVVVTGFDEVPPVGANFKVVSSLKTAAEAAQKFQQRQKPLAPLLALQPDQKVLNLILKVDVAGSQEAIEQCLAVIPQKEVVLRILTAKVGNISETDVKLAQASKAQIFGFRVAIDPSAKNLAQQAKIKIKTFQIIYELVEIVRQTLEKLLSPEIKEETLGKGKVIAVFKQEKTSMILGAKMLQGKVNRGNKIKIWRDKKILGQGRVRELQFEKRKVSEVEKGKNAGILLEGCGQVQKGDILEFYQEVRGKKELY